SNRVIRIERHAPVNSGRTSTDPVQQSSLYRRLDDTQDELLGRHVVSDEDLQRPVRRLESDELRFGRKPTFAPVGVQLNGSFTKVDEGRPRRAFAPLQSLRVSAGLRVESVQGWAAGASVERLPARTSHDQLDAVQRKGWRQFRREVQRVLAWERDRLL